MPYLQIFATKSRIYTFLRQKCCISNFCDKNNFPPPPPPGGVESIRGNSVCLFVCPSSLQPFHFMMFQTIQTIHFLKALGPRISKLIFPSVSYKNTQIQIHKYTNTAHYQVPERPNKWHIFEKRIVQGYQKLHSHTIQT